jgi:hypothetical protein
VIGVIVAEFFAFNNTTTSVPVWIMVALEALFLVACVAIGAVLMTRGERGIGLGLVIGWAVGVIVLPVVGAGVCVAVFATMGGGGG